MKRWQTKRKLGLTLVEILIVIAVIALLAVVSIPNYLKSRETANAASVEQSLRQIAQKMEQIYWSQNPNEYPPESAMASGLVAWAAPTNLGNMMDLLELLRRLCLELGLITPDSSTVLTQEQLMSLANACLSHPSGQLQYVEGVGLQDYSFFAIVEGKGTYRASNSGVLLDTSPPAEPPPPPPTCGNGVWEDWEECGEEGWDYCGDYYECINCTCQFAGCPPNYVEYDGYCYISSPAGCSGGFILNGACCYLGLMGQPIHCEDPSMLDVGGGGGQLPADPGGG